MENALKEERINLKMRIMICLIFLIAINLPYLIACLMTPGDMVFTGILIDSTDTSTYLSKMGNAQYGFSYLNNFTTGDIYGGYHFLFYILLGKIALISGLKKIFVYHLSRTIISLFFCYVLYGILDQLLSKENQKNILAFLILSGSSIPPIKSLARIFNPDLPYYYNFIPEIFPSTSALYFPHFILVMLLQVLCIKYTLDYAQSRNKNLLMISFLLLLMALVHPYMCVLMGIIIGFYIFINDIKNKNLTFKNILKLLIIPIMSLPYLIYSLYAFLHYPMLKAWQSNWIASSQAANNILSRFLVITLLLTTVILILLIRNWQKSGKRSLFIIWLCFSMTAIMLPTHLNIRFSEGIAIPAFLLFGWFLTEKLSKHRWLLVIFTIIFTLNTFILAIEPAFSTSVICYITKEQREIYDWIETNVSYEEIIFSDFLNGNLIPGMTGKRVAFGHNHESKDVLEWKEQQQYISRTGDLNVLKENEIDYYLMNKKQSKYPDKNEAVKVLETDNYIIYKIIND